MEIIDNVSFWTLDYNLNVIQEANNDFYSKYSSPMKEGDDGFWYFAFLLHFEKNLSFVKGSYPIILGIKFKDEHFYEIKLKNDKLGSIQNNEDLIRVFDKINDQIKNCLNINLILNPSKKIGFNRILSVDKIKLLSYNISN